MIRPALGFTLAIVTIAGAFFAPREVLADATPAPSPAPFRLLYLGPYGSLGTVQGNIVVLDGVSGVRYDGSEAAACVSFKNLDSRVALRVVFEILVLGPGGKQLASLTLDRNGRFSPNIAIYTNINENDINPSLIEGNMPDSCADDVVAPDAPPIVGVSSFGYRVKRVEYADGTSWTPTP